MGARASGGPQARAGLLLLLLPLLLGLLAPGAQAARGRGGTEKNSYRRTVNTFSQSVSSLFGEDNVRVAQKVGVGPAPSVTLPRPPRTWRRGRPGPCAASGAWKEGCSVPGWGCRACAPMPAGSVSVLAAGSGLWPGHKAAGRRLFHTALLLGPCPLGRCRRASPGLR